MGLPSVFHRLIPDRFQVPSRYWKRMLLRRMEPELGWFLRNVPQDKLMLDVGANVGLYSYAAARSGRVVHAFEPFPRNAALLRTIRPAVQVHEVALSDAAGSLTLSIPLIDGKLRHGLATLGAQYSEMQTVETVVPVRTLDSFNLENVGALKIDTEGFELPVLRGAASVIERDHPVLLVEIVSEWLDRPLREAFAWIESLGYDEGHFLDDSLHERSLRDYDENHHQTRGGVKPPGRGAQTFLWRPLTSARSR